MTREEAIKQITEYIYDGEDNAISVEAGEMAISALSVPEREKGEYIKKEDVLFKKWQFKFKDVDREYWFVDVKDIESLPTYSFPEREKETTEIEDVVKVVRCKDCIYSDHWYGDHQLCTLWSEGGIGVFDDGFCNYGKESED